MTELLLLPNPFQGMGAWQKTRGRGEAGRQRVNSWTVQNDMRGVPRRCGKDSRFCKSWRDKSLTVGCVHCSEDKRELKKEWQRSTSSSVEIEGTCVSKNLVETVRLHSKKEKSGYER